MKNLVLLLVFIPLFLITALNFHNGNEDLHYNETNRFTCTSCHANIIDGIIIGGKEVDPDYVSFEVLIPASRNYQNIVFDMQRKQNQNTVVSEYTEDIIGEFLLMDLDKDRKAKKANSIKIKHEITDEERSDGFIEIQGVFTNLDGTKAGEFAFSKKISLENNETKIVEPKYLYPSLANQNINIEHLTLNSNIQIFNVLGQQVLSQQNTSSNQKIDVSRFENGSYFVLINQKDQLRFVVSK